MLKTKRAYESAETGDGERFLVDRPVLERSDERGERSPKPRLGSHDKFLDTLVKAAPAAALHDRIAGNTRSVRALKDPLRRSPWGQLAGCAQL